MKDEVPDSVVPLEAQGNAVALRHELRVLEFVEVTLVNLRCLSSGASISQPDRQALL